MSTNKDPEETIRQLESRLQKLEKEQAEQRRMEEQGNDALLLGYVIGAPIALILSIASSLPLPLIIFMAILALYIWIVAGFRLGR